MPPRHSPRHEGDAYHQARFDPSFLHSGESYIDDLPSRDRPGGASIPALSFRHYSLYGHRQLTRFNVPDVPDVPWDLDQVSSYDWGSCALTYLYRSMDELVRRGKRFCGF